jgi:hypothetical protein
MLLSSSTTRIFAIGVLRVLNDGCSLAAADSRGIVCTAFAQKSSPLAPTLCVCCTARRQTASIDPEGVVTTVWDGGGQEAVLLGVLLMGWSKAGESLPGTSINMHYVGALLVLASLIRVPAQSLRSNALIDLSLAVDAYALAVYCGEHHRQKNRSPRRDAGLFAAAMPLERELQSRLGSDLMSAPLPAAHS